MSGNFHDANYNVTKIRTEDGKVVELELNNKPVPLGNDIEDDREITFAVLDYKEPVELKPSTGMRAMKQVTLTLALPDILKPTTISVELDSENAGSITFEHCPGSVPNLNGVWHKKDGTDKNVILTSISIETSHVYTLTCSVEGEEDPYDFYLYTENSGVVIFGNS